MHSFPDALDGEKIVGIIVTNENHARATADFVNRWSVPIYAHEQTRAGLETCDVRTVADGQKIAPGLTAIALAGAPAGEIALHDEADGGTLIIGDALINMESHGFTFLPGKYCQNAKLMRKSLARLLDYSFERILFAHGSRLSRVRVPVSLLCWTAIAEIAHE